MKGDIILKISEDVEITKFGDKEFLLINSRQNSYVKINEYYYQLLHLIDGKRNLNEIRNEYNLLSCRNISHELLIKLIEKIDQYCIFSESIPSKRPKFPSYIKFGFIILTPSMISKITPVMNIFFKKYMYILVLFLGLSMFSYKLHSHFGNTIDLNVSSIVPTFIVMMAFSVFFHEFGHATAAHHFGAKHGGIGGGFYLYYMPILFANVTDIWRLKRWERIIINCSGVYFELIFFIILSLLSWLFNNPTLEFLSFFIFIKSFYNLVPFLRADGYWVLSDLFNKPNLSFHSFRNLKLIFSSLCRLKIPTLKYADYILAFYGFINIFLIVAFYYYTIFYQYETIVKVPSIIYRSIISLLKGENFHIDLNHFSSYFSVLIFYFVSIRLLLDIARKLIIKFNPSSNRLG